MRGRTPGRRRAAAAAALATALLTFAGPATGAAPAPDAAHTRAPASAPLRLVTLRGPGLAGATPASPARRAAMLRAQERVLAQVGAPRPAYRWTSALNGFAVRLTTAQATRAAALPAVAAVETNAVRRLAGAPRALTGPPQPALPGRGGAGVVIGVVDSGLDPSGPLFADVPGLGAAVGGFRGICVPAEGWPRGACGRKVVAARWYVEGFGRAALRASATLSPRDDSGHGTLVASVAAGNAGVSVRVRGQRLGAYTGVAPQARVAVYKACWTAADPVRDGCASADLVTAVDQATADGVDVLTLAVDGGTGIDTVDRALLGASEGGTFVVAAAGNDSRRKYAAHAVPWVTTVGASVGATREGRVSGAGLDSLGGATSAPRSVSGRLVRAVDAVAPGATPAAARVCRPGSLDVGRVAGAIVVCARGEIGRVDKSATVALADGIGMVLTDRGSVVHADLHRVPTLHLDAAASRALERWHRSRPGAWVTLRPVDPGGGPERVLASSATGDPAGALVKPDVISAGVDVLGALPAAAASGDRWGFFSGSSAAAARVGGQAAVIRSHHPRWSPAMVRSALVTSARPVAGEPSALRQGAGQPQLTGALRPGLVYPLDAAGYRRFLDGGITGPELNLPAVKLRGPGVVRRTVTHVGDRATYFSSRARGFTDHRVRVTPAAIRVGPGERRTFTVTVSGRRTRGVDSGWVTWRGADGTAVRIPVVVTD